MKVCVTGGAGFIGSHLVDRLVRDGHDVTVLDDLSTGSLDNLAASLSHVQMLQDDLRDFDAVSRAVTGAEVVFHQGALAAVARSVEQPQEVNDVNLGGTLNVLIAARDAGARRIVFASSSSVYGDTPTLPKVESMPTSPLSPYAASKASSESYLSGFQGSYGLETVALRYFNVFGPRQSPKSLYAAVVPLFIDAMQSGHAPMIFGDGEQTRDFSYVADVVDANCRAAVAPDPDGRPINIGGGDRISINELVRVIAERTGFQGDATYEPARVGDVRHSLADITRARDWMGWEPGTTLTEGIDRIVSGAENNSAVGSTS